MSTRDIHEAEQPASPEAEGAILGGGIRNNALMGQIIDSLEIEDLHVAAHRRIYSAMRDLYRRDSAIDPLLIADELKLEGTLEMVGGVTYITSLVHGLPYSTNVEHYIKIVKAKALSRAMYRIGLKIAEEAVEQENPATVTLDRAQSALSELAQTKGGRTIESIQEVAAKVRERLESLRRGENPAIASPWQKLNGMTRGGIHKTELWGISAIMKMGKSATLKQWAARNNREKIRTLYFSREMSSEQIMFRMLAAETGITNSLIRYGLDSDRIDQLIASSFDVAKHGSLFFETKTSSIIETRRKLQEMVRLEAIEMVVWDYTQCFSAGKKTYSRADEVSAIWRGMKDMVQDFNLAGCAVAQFSREAVKSDERPKFHMTEGSGEAEKAVSVGIVLHTEFDKGAAGARPAKFHIDYQRDESAGGEVALLFNGRIMEFHELPTEEPETETEQQTELDLNA